MYIDLSLDFKLDIINGYILLLKISDTAFLITLQSQYITTGNKMYSLGFLHKDLYIILQLLPIVFYFSTFSFN